LDSAQLATSRARQNRSCGIEHNYRVSPEGL
jgi:hypothetical protein